MIQHRPDRNRLVAVGLFVAGIALSMAVAGPAAAAGSPTPTPSPSATVAPSAVPSASTSVLSAAPTPIVTEPGSIQVPAGNAFTGKSDSGSPWTPIALLGGGVLLLGAGALTVARRR